MRDFKKAVLKSLSVKIENPLFHAFAALVNFMMLPLLWVEHLKLWLYFPYSSHPMTEIAPKHIFFSIMLCCMMMIATGNDQ